MTRKQREIRSRERSFSSPRWQRPESRVEGNEGQAERRGRGRSFGYPLYLRLRPALRSKRLNPTVAFCSLPGGCRRVPQGNDCVGKVDASLACFHSLDLLSHRSGGLEWLTGGRCFFCPSFSLCQIFAFPADVSKGDWRSRSCF